MSSVHGRKHTSSSYTFNKNIDSNDIPVTSIDVNLLQRNVKAALVSLRAGGGRFDVGENRIRGRGRGRGRNAKPEPEPDPVKDPNIHPISRKAAVAFGIVLALNSGIVNGVCLSGILSADGTKQASAAVTGAWTNSALGVASGNLEKFVFNYNCIFSYLGGSFIAGFLNPKPKPFEIAVSNFRALFFIGALLLYGSSTLSEEPEKVFIYLAAMANGIQNSLTSTTTANLVRSAHFSGITSDMGTFMGQIVRGNLENLPKLKVFASLSVAFWTGGFASYSLTNNYGKDVLLFSSMLYVILGLAVGSV